MLCCATSAHHAINYSDLVLVSTRKSRRCRLEDLLKLARAQPGQAELCGRPAGTPYSHGRELFKAMAGVDILTALPRSSAHGTDSSVAKFDMMFDCVTGQREQRMAGKVRGLLHVVVRPLRRVAGDADDREAGVPGL